MEVVKNMTGRSVDKNGDILPVISGADLLTGPEALAAGLRDHLRMYSGDWWENPEKGNEILELMAEARQTDEDAEALGSYLVGFLMEFVGVREVTEVSAFFKGRVFCFSCVAHTERGDTAVSFSL